MESIKLWSTEIIGTYSDNSFTQLLGKTKGRLFSNKDVTGLETNKEQQNLREEEYFSPLS